MKNKKILFFLICCLLIFILTGCNMPFLPDASSVSNIVENISTTNQTQSEVKESQKTEDIVDIIIDGTIKTESKKNEETEETHQTKLVREIMSALQEENTFSTTLSLSYEGDFNKNIINVNSSSFKNEIELTLYKDLDNEYMLNGNGYFNSNGDISNNLSYNILRYCSNSNKVYYQSTATNNYCWKQTSSSESSFPRLGLDKTALKNALNTATLTEEKNYYIFTVNESIEDAFSVISIGTLEKILNDKNLLEKNITYQIKVSKSNYLIKDIYLEKSFNDLQIKINHDNVFNLSKDAPKIEGSIKNTYLSNFKIILKYDFNQNKDIYIDNLILYESKNGSLNKDLELKTNLTKYDFYDKLNNNTKIVATFDCSQDSQIKGNGYLNGLKCDFYQYTGITTLGKYIGTLEFCTKKDFLGKHMYDSLEELECKTTGEFKVYKFTNLENETNYYIQINDSYGFIYSNKETNTSTTNLKNILSYISIK